MKMSQLGGGEEKPVGSVEIKTPETKERTEGGFLGIGGTKVPAKGGGSQKYDVFSMPASPSQAVKGRVYQTAKGPAMWNGKAFVPVGE
jgi:hypothetical protein